MLVCITDGMDRSKFCLPRFQEGRIPKDCEDLRRPRCNLTATIVHGRAIYVAVSDEDQHHGAAWSLENLNRALELVAFLHEDRLAASRQHASTLDQLPSNQGISARPTDRAPVAKCSQDFLRQYAQGRIVPGASTERQPLCGTELPLINCRTGGEEQYLCTLVRSCHGMRSVRPYLHGEPGRGSYPRGYWSLVSKFIMFLEFTFSWCWVLVRRL